MLQFDALASSRPKQLASDYLRQLLTECVREASALDFVRILLDIGQDT
jgi:hypothetical protein